MRSMQELRQGSHGHGHDYAAGFPYNRHFVAKSMIVGQLQAMVREIVDTSGRCRVLEVAASHGTFTDFLVSGGATVEVTEMRKPSAAWSTQGGWTRTLGSKVCRPNTSGFVAKGRIPC
jgi:hypothetical protein